MCALNCRGYKSARELGTSIGRLLLRRAPQHCREQDSQNSPFVCLF
jgi:hypothetical protein